MSNNDLKTTEFNNIQMDEQKTPNTPTSFTDEEYEKLEEIPQPVLAKKKGRPIGSKKARPVLMPDPVPVPIKVMCDAECQTDPIPEPEPIPCAECSQPKEKKASKKDNPNYYKEYYETNKEIIRKQKKDWREKNKDKVNTEKKKEYQKEYDAKNKEKIKKRRERLILCECGETLKHFSLRGHRNKSQTHKLKIELRKARGENIVLTADFNEEENDTSSISSSELSGSTDEQIEA
jgi:hypothetical protein